MKEIRILHIFPKLLSLYGEYGNVAILTKTLTDRGYPVTVDTWDSGDLNLNSYDLVYVGSGTEDNLNEAIRRLKPYADEIRQCVESGNHWLATGNAMALFGRNGLGILPYDCVTETTARYMGDVLTEDCFGAPLVGYINTGCRFEGIEMPLFRLRFGKKLNNSKGSGCDEGIQYHQFYGTQLIGPVLVKNPHFLEKIASAITGDEIRIGEDTYLKKAYAVTLRELEKRANQ